MILFIMFSELAVAFWVFRFYYCTASKFHDLSLGMMLNAVVEAKSRRVTPHGGTTFFIDTICCRSSGSLPSPSGRSVLLA
jgi:hypothetical protein